MRVACIVCNACESNCPEVFHVETESSTIRPEALDVQFLTPLTSAIFGDHKTIVEKTQMVVE